MTPRDVFDACLSGARVGIATALTFGVGAVIAAAIHAASGAPAVESLGLVLCAAYAVLAGVWSTHCALMCVRRHTTRAAPPTSVRGVTLPASSVVIDVRSQDSRRG